MAHIYILKDPSTNEVRYVGASANPKNRLYSHLFAARWPEKHNGNTDRSKWIRSLLESGNSPAMEIVERDCADIIAAERSWIARYREAGARRTICSDGGDMADGFKRSPETGAKISASKKGKMPRWSPEGEARVA